MFSINFTRDQQKQWYINELNYEIERITLLFKDGQRQIDWRGAINDIPFVILMLREEKKNIELENFHLLPPMYKNTLNALKK